MFDSTFILDQVLLPADQTISSSISIVGPSLLTLDLNNLNTSQLGNVNVQSIVISVNGKQDYFFEGLTVTTTVSSNVYGQTLGEIISPFPTNRYINPKLKYTKKLGAGTYTISIVVILSNLTINTISLNVFVNKISIYDVNSNFDILETRCNNSGVVYNASIKLKDFYTVIYNNATTVGLTKRIPDFSNRNIKSYKIKLRETIIPTPEIPPAEETTVSSTKKTTPTSTTTLTTSSTSTLSSSTTSTSSTTTSTSWSSHSSSTTTSSTTTTTTTINVPPGVPDPITPPEPEWPPFIPDDPLSSSTSTIDTGTDTTTTVAPPGAISSTTTLDIDTLSSTDIDTLSSTDIDTLSSTVTTMYDDGHLSSTLSSTVTTMYDDGHLSSTLSSTDTTMFDTNTTAPGQ